jgi:tight adherence protein C
MLGLPPDPEADATLGGAVVLAVPAWSAHPLLAASLITGGLALPVVRRRRHERTVLRSVVRDLPWVVDLMALSISALGSVHLAVVQVAEQSDGPIGAALREAVHRAESGTRLADALEHSLAPLGDPARSLSRALTSSERYGVPLATALERVGDEARRRRRRQAETEARRVPVRLLLPLALCMLPAFVLVTVVPLAVRTIHSLDLG